VLIAQPAQIHVAEQLLRQATPIHRVRDLLHELLSHLQGFVVVLRAFELDSELGNDLVLRLQEAHRLANTSADVAHILREGLRCGRGSVVRHPELAGHRLEHPKLVRGHAGFTTELPEARQAAAQAVQRVHNAGHRHSRAEACDADRGQGRVKDGLGGVCSRLGGGFGLVETLRQSLTVSGTVAAGVE
jgi:hypothetical protein